MVHGIINVYKEKGYTSFDAVARLKGIFGQRKIGHTGTLDPDAEGVLPICLGKATKVCELLTDRQKEYEAVMLLGKTTDTQDLTGTVLTEHEVLISEEQLAETVESFVGNYLQVPPMYSALKVDGRKLCDLARQGKTVERKARPVVIYEIEVQKIELPYVTMRVRCSKGTYIRTLCQDIGEKAGCGACMASLIRTDAAGFQIKDALKIGEIEALVKEFAGGIPKEQWKTELFPFIRSIDSLFLDYPKASVFEQYEKALYNGNRLERKMLSGQEKADTGEPVRIYDEKGRFIGIYEFCMEKGDYKPVKLFMEEKKDK